MKKFVITVSLFVLAIVFLVIATPISSVNAAAGSEGGFVIQTSGVINLEGLNKLISVESVKMDAQGNLHVNFPDKQPSAEEVDVNQCFSDLRTIDEALNKMPEIKTDDDYFTVLQLEALRDSIMDRCLESENFAQNLMSMPDPRCSDDKIGAFCKVYCTYLQKDNSYDDCYDGWFVWDGCIQKTKDQCLKFWKRWDEKHPVR